MKILIKQCLGLLKIIIDLKFDSKRLITRSPVMSSLSFL